MRQLIFVVLSAVLPSVVAFHASSEQPLAATGTFIGISVADLAASTEWYQKAFDLEVTKRIPKTNGAAVTVLEGSGMIVELVQQDTAVALSTAAPSVKDEVQVYGVFKVGLTVNDFDAAIALLRRRGVAIAFGPFPARGNERANAIIRDNAGNLLQVFGPASSK